MSDNMMPIDEMLGISDEDVAAVVKDVAAAFNDNMKMPDAVGQLAEKYSAASVMAGMLVSKTLARNDLMHLCGETSGEFVDAADDEATKDKRSVSDLCKDASATCQSININLISLQRRRELGMPVAATVLIAYAGMQALDNHMEAIRKAVMDGDDDASEESC